MPKVLVATEKPFAKAAITQIKAQFDNAGYECLFLEKYQNHDELVEAAKGADALIIRSDKVDAEVLKNASNLKIVVRAGAGYDNVDLAAATENDVVVMNTPGQNSNAVAELIFGLLVYQVRNGFNGTAGSELKGKKIGIHAYGNVGVNVARIAKGFGMEVCAFDPFVPKETIEADGVQVMNTVEAMYGDCDFISLHLPANEHTIKSINFDLLSNMKEGATLVNTARKEVINEDDLVKIFEQKETFHYISDIAPDNKALLEKDYGNRCFFTPKKMGAQTAEANINAGIAAAKQIIGFFEEGITTFKVN